MSQQNRARKGKEKNKSTRGWYENVENKYIIKTYLLEKMHCRQHWYLPHRLVVRDN